MDRDTDNLLRSTRERTAYLKQMEEDPDRVIKEFEASEKSGNASIKVDGKLVDYAMYNQAKSLLQRFRPDVLTN